MADGSVMSEEIPGSGVDAGVIGVGNMGRGVARSLRRAGYATAVWDASGAALEALGPDFAVLRPPAMARAGATIFFAVPGSAEIAASLDAVLDNAQPGSVIYDLTTSAPQDTQRANRLAAARGVAYLDAAMSGGASGAEAGTLTLMVGGDRDALEKTRPLLEAFADDIFHLGGSGAGHTMKLIHNMVCHTIFLATAEGGRLCERAGLALEDMIAVFNVSNARSYASEVRFPRHILSGKWDGRSRIHNLHKDVAMAVDLARGHEVDTSLADAALACLEAAANLGMADEDFTLLYRDFDRVRTRMRRCPTEER